MNVFIRCDIGGNHGCGHAVRMRALAGALRTRGASVTFVTTTPALASFVDPCPTHVMAAEILTDTIQRLTRWQLRKVLVIDHKYGYHPSRLMEIRHYMPVVRMDEPRATPATCDLLIAPNVHWSPDTISQLRKTFGARFLEGWDYVMLAPEVTSEGPLPWEVRRRGPVVVCAGGSDPSGAMAVLREKVVGLDLGVALEWMPPGSGARYRQALREAGMVIGMFGITAYECLWYQTPMLMGTHTDENRLGALRLQAQAPGQVYTLGGLAMWTKEAFGATVKTWYCGHQLGKPIPPGRMDGRGVSRVAEAILAL